MKASLTLGAVALLIAGASFLPAAELEEGSSTPIKLKRTIPGSVDPLGETVELTFRVKSDNPQTLTITSATTKYGMEIRFAGANAAAHIELAGDLRLIVPASKAASSADTKLLITCQAFIGYDADVMIDSYVVSSAVVGFGEERELAKFGAVTLTVQAKRV